MKRIILYITTFVLFFAISVISHVPASFALKYAPAMRGVTLTGVTGTIWHGSTQKLTWNNQQLGQVYWDFQPSQLLKGKAAYSLRFGRGSDLNFSGKGVVGADFSGLYAENIVASVPAKNIQSKVNMPLPIDVSGQVELSINDYRYASPWCESAQGTLVWNASEINSPLAKLSLGTIITDITCSNSVLSAVSAHDSKQIAGAFNAELNADKRYKADAWFKPNSEFPSGLKSQLKWLGNPNSQGRYSFVYSGKLR